MLYCAMADLWQSALTRLFSWRRRKPSHPPKKILLANCGSLGDVVLSGWTIAAIKKTYPNCQIGLMITEESKAACATIPPIDWIHPVSPCFSPNQSTGSRIIQFIRFLLFEQSRLAKEVSKIGYDIAVELRPFFPNMIGVFWKAKIPIRIGFKCGGNVPLLTSSSDLPLNGYLSDSYKALLRLIGIDSYSAHAIFLNNRSVLPVVKPYWIFHPCSSDSSKEHPIQLWQKLYAWCEELGLNVYFTGKGEREFQVIQKIIDRPEKNFCNRSDWPQFVQLIGEASGIVSIDSVPIHIASALKIPTVALFQKSKFCPLWRPSASSTFPLGMEGAIEVENIVRIILDCITMR